MMMMMMIQRDGIADLLADIGPRPILSISPDTSMLEAIRKLCLYHVHRLPVIDLQSGNLLCLLTHKRLLNYLYNFVSRMASCTLFPSTPLNCIRAMTFVYGLRRKIVL